MALGSTLESAEWPLLLGSKAASLLLCLAHIGLELTLQSRLALGSEQSACLSLLNAGGNYS